MSHKRHPERLSRDAWLSRVTKNFLIEHEGQRGVGAIEFALIAPFLLLLIVAIIEMSNVYFTRSQLSEITRDATRRFAVGALEKSEVEGFVLKRLATATKMNGEVTVDEIESGDITDVTLSLSVPFADILLFDQLIEGFWASAPSHLSVNATMMKH